MGHSDGKITDTGIGLIRDIKAVIGAGYKDIGNLCRSGNVNVYSFRHPLNTLNKSGKTTDQQFYDNNDGIMSPLLLNSFSSMFSYVGSSVAWQRYSPSVYRMGDFSGYDHKIKRWFDIDIRSTAVGGNEVSTIIPGENAYMQFVNMAYNESRASGKYNAGWMVSNFNMFSGLNASDFHYAAVLFQGSGSSGCYVKIGTSVTDSGSDKYAVGISIPVSASNAPAAGTYKVFPCITNFGASGTWYDQSDVNAAGYKWYPLESNVCEVTIGTAGNLLDFIEATKNNFISNDGTTFSGGTFTFTINPGLFQLKNTYSRSQTVHYSLWYGKWTSASDLTGLTNIYTSSSHTLLLNENGGTGITADPSNMPPITYPSLTNSVTLVLMVTLGSNDAKFFKVTCNANKGDVEWGDTQIDKNY